MDERVCSIALTLCDGIGVIGAKTLIESVGSASEIFKLRDSLRDVLPDISPKLIAALDNKEAQERAEREIAFAEQKGIQCLTLNDTRYPVRLKNCPDAPPILFFKGHAVSKISCCNHSRNLQIFCLFSGFFICQQPSILFYPILRIFSSPFCKKFEKLYTNKVF